MRNFVPNAKQKLSLEKYQHYLSEEPEPTDKLHNKRNMFDDLNSSDKTIMKEVRIYISHNDKAIYHNN